MFTHDVKQYAVLTPGAAEYGDGSTRIHFLVGLFIWLSSNPSPRKTFGNEDHNVYQTHLALQNNLVVSANVLRPISGIPVLPPPLI